MTTENKAETRRILSLAGSIKSLLDKATRAEDYATLRAADLLKIAEYADILQALILHEDTEIRVME